MYVKWKPITWHALYDFLSLFVDTGLNKRPYISRIICLKMTFIIYLGITELRERYEVIYHTMVHAGGINENNAQESS